MVRFIIRRLLSGLLVLFLFQSVVFFIVQIILPGDFVSHLVLGLTLSEAQEMRAALGLDLPIWERYLAWVMGLLQGDLGMSYTWFGGTGPSVISILKSVVPASILVFGLGTLIAFVIGSVMLLEAAHPLLSTRPGLPAVAALSGREPGGVYRSGAELREDLRCVRDSLRSVRIEQR